MSTAVAVTLVRTESNAYATYGRIEDDEHKVLVPATLELPWRNNVHGESCVPPGEYTAIRYRSPKRGFDVFMLTGVPNRSAIELHVGNTPNDTEGCILLGSSLCTFPDGQHGISGSTQAFERFMAALSGVDYLTFLIRDPE